MSNGHHLERKNGLPGDIHETGSVLRIKDILKPLSSSPELPKSWTLIGFASDEGVRRNFGRQGAASAPQAIREFLTRLPVHQTLALTDFGDITCEEGLLEKAQEKLADKITETLALGHKPLVLGGGHEVAFGSFLGLSRFLGANIAQRKIGIINLDAHFDLRLADKPNSGTPFRQIAELCKHAGTEFNYLCYGISKLGNTTALFERAKELNVFSCLDETLRERNMPGILEDLREKITAFDDLYLSIDLDVLPASVAPGVSAPAARGVCLEFIEDLIDTIIASGKLRIADLAEVNPRLDQDHQTVRVAARLAYRLVTAD